MNEDDRLLEAALHSMNEEITVPPPQLVYWRAELRARRERMESALRPARWMEVGAVAGLSGAALFAASSSGSAVVGAAVGVFLAVAAATAVVLRKV